jgi:hypothetical protein
MNQAINRRNSLKIQREYQEGLRCKGFNVITVNGTTEEQLSLSGFAEQLLGIVALPGAPAGTTIQLTVNNDQVIEEANVDFFETDPANPRQYYDFARPLLGSDSLTLRVNSTAAGNLQILVYFQNRAI